MLFNNLPLINTDNSELLAYQSTTGAVGRIPNDYQATLDGVISSLVMARATQSQTLADHISNKSLHAPIEDSVTTPITTWSSSKIQSAIDGSSPWFNLDSIPEGSTNLYYTTTRGIDLVNQTTLGVTTVDHQAVATQLASVLLGFNSSTFRYVLAPDETPGVDITVDGVPTTDYFDTTPGTAHSIQVSQRDRAWVCKELAHKIILDDSEGTVVTPKLTLDAFTSGETNKIWSEETYADSQVFSDIVDHINTNFTTYHAEIRDSSFASRESTWSSNKIQTEVIQAIKNNTTFTATKETAIAQEWANSGQNASTYNWTTDNNGNGTYTHYIKRLHRNYDYSGSGASLLSDELRIRTGTWFVYWRYVDSPINPYFTGVTNVATYLAYDQDLRTPVLHYPGILTLSETSEDIVVVTRFTCNQPYSSTYRNTWLVPKAVPGIREFYGSTHVERIR